MAYLASHHDPALVAASVLIAALSAGLLLDLATRMRAGEHHVAHGLWVGGSIAVGTGLWAMQFVGLLAYSLPIELGSAGPMTFVSWLTSVAVCAVALRIAGSAALSPQGVAGGALAMGLGLCAMHAAGIAALEMTPEIVWDRWLLGAAASINARTRACARRGGSARPWRSAWRWPACTTPAWRRRASRKDRCASARTR